MIPAYALLDPVATCTLSDGTTIITAPDGTITMPVEGPDPRFGMQAPILKSLTVQTPFAVPSACPIEGFRSTRHDVSP